MVYEAFICFREGYCWAMGCPVNAPLLPPLPWLPEGPTAPMPPQKADGARDAPQRSEEAEHDGEPPLTACAESAAPPMHRSGISKANPSCFTDSLHQMTWKVYEGQVEITNAQGIIIRLLMMFNGGKKHAQTSDALDLGLGNGTETYGGPSRLQKPAYCCAPLQIKVLANNTQMSLQCLPVSYAQNGTPGGGLAGAIAGAKKCGPNVRQ
jgi:hypothetical protein